MHFLVITGSTESGAAGSLPQQRLRTFIIKIVCCIIAFMSRIVTLVIFSIAEQLKLIILNKRTVLNWLMGLAEDSGELKFKWVSDCDGIEATQIDHDGGQFKVLILAAGGGGGMMMSKEISICVRNWYFCTSQDGINFYEWSDPTWAFLASHLDEFIFNPSLPRCTWLSSFPQISPIGGVFIHSC